ncbi:hypothetical protein ACQ86N_26035 [Puia sp. P3]|uniref:hypothetical protein n=1 Tax=Puia sp. P3 TaxID=3423952 RepID=UPI003D67A8F9
MSRGTRSPVSRCWRPITRPDFLPVHRLIRGLFNFARLPVKGKYSFTFSGVSFQPQTLSGYVLKADASTSIIVKMKSQAGSLSEVVVVGYGTQKRANLTGAVAQVSGDVLDRRSMPNMTQGLQGLIPNLNLTPADGKPISSATYNIRGATSIGQGGASAGADRRGTG